MEFAIFFTITIFVGLIFFISFCRKSVELKKVGHVFGFIICFTWPLSFPFAVCLGAPRCDKILKILGLKD